MKAYAFSRPHEYAVSRFGLGVYGIPIPSASGRGVGTFADLSLDTARGKAIAELHAVTA